MLAQSKPLHPAGLIVKQQVLVAPCHVSGITEDRYTFLMMTSKWERIYTELRSLAALQQRAFSFNTLVKPSPNTTCPTPLFHANIVDKYLCWEG